MRQVRIFVSSPSDVLPERERLQRVCERLSHQLDGLDLKPYFWERGRYFSAHDTFQKQIPETSEFDLVVGIVWSRIGLPPPEGFPKMPDGRPYPSGTAYEILTAIEHRRKGGKLPDILFYRKVADVPVKPGAAEAGAATEGLRGLEAFLREWFFNPTEGFKAAFETFGSTDAFEATVEAHLRDWLQARGWMGRERQWRIVERGSPFAGLEAFDERRSEVFFGRSREIGRLQEILRAAEARGVGFLLIEGASGTGKSSLARAGLVPRLILPRSGEPERRAAVLVPGADPILALATALVAALPELAEGDYPGAEALARHLGQGGGVEPVIRALDRWSRALALARQADQPPATALVLTVDQFEEVFAPDVAGAARGALMTALDRLARSGRVAVIVVLRADAGGAARALPLFPALVNEGAALTLSPPGPAELKEIILGPAAMAGIGFERRDGESLDERLLAEAAGPNALPLLQFVLESLYAAAPKTPDAAEEGGDYATLRFADHDRLGGLAGAIGRAAAAAFDPLPPAVRARLPLLVRALTATGPGDGFLLIGADHAAATRDAEGAALAEALVKARILVRDGATLRFAHQRVIEAWDMARSAAEEGRSLIRIRDEVAAERQRWETEGRPRGRLISGVRLAEAIAATRQDEGLMAPSADYIRRSRSRARLGLTLTAGAAAVFLGVALAAGWFYLSADRNARLAEASAAEALAQRDRATAALRQATQAANTLVFDLAQGFADQGLPSSLTRAILDRARSLQDSLAANFPDDPDLVWSKAAALMELADLSARQGDGPAALADIETALAIFRKLAQDDPDDGRQRDLSVALERLGERKADMGDTAGAEAAWSEALAIRRARLAARPGDTRAMSDLAVSLAKQGGMKQDAGDLAGAEADFREGLALVKAMVAAEPASAEWRREESQALTQLGDLQELKGDLTAAIAAYEEALDLLRALAKGEPANTQFQADLATVLNGLGHLRSQAGDAAGSETAYDQSLDTARTLADSDPGNSRWQRLVAVTLNDLAGLKRLSGDSAAARDLYDQALAVARRLSASDPENLQWRRDIAVSLNFRGDLKREAGDAQGAMADYGKSLSIARSLVAADPGKAFWQRDVAIGLDNVAQMKLASGDAEGAEAAWTESLAIRRDLADRDPSNTEAARDLSISLDHLGQVRLQAGDLAGAETLYVEDLAIARRLAAADPGNTGAARDLAITLNRVGDLRARQGDLAAAGAAYAEGLALMRRLSAADPANLLWQRDVSISLDRMGNVALARQDLAAAADLYRQSLTLRRSLAAADPASAIARRDVIVSLWNLTYAEPDKAQPRWQEIVALFAALDAEGLLSASDQALYETARTSLSKASK